MSLLASSWHASYDLTNLDMCLLCTHDRNACAHQNPEKTYGSLDKHTAHCMAPGMTYIMINDQIITFRDNASEVH